MWKKAAYVLIFAGILLLLWPQAREWVDDYRQEQLLKEARAALSSPVSGDALREYEDLTHLFQQEADASDHEPAASGGAVSPSPSPAAMAEGVIAILRIAKIDLELPVLEGASQANMKVGAAHMAETSSFGEVGNAAIAAHRARTYGRLFNRLNEIEVGDDLEMDYKGAHERYTVFRVVRVLPTDLSVLDGNGKDEIITLITCDPIDTATHRIIVQAKKEPATPS
ncbi:class D sortase [Gorillibacterium sp. CAU 1737]|uniref:class D sortase n=1 Tax=Gorillibacterium sp. CAU 1737 TaxID=3140362 RepID=UPI0032606890